MPETTNITRLPQQFGWLSAYWTGAVAAFAYTQGTPRFEELKERYAIRGIEHIPLSADTDDRIVFVRFDNCTYMGVEGTARVSQWLKYLTDFGLAEDDRGRQFPHFFLANALRAVGIAKSKVAKSTPLVVSGHSLGGAVATIAGQFLYESGWNVQSVWTFGSPRPGQGVFAMQYSLPNFRIVAPNDIVPKVPFDGYYAAQSPSGIDVPGRYWLMTHVGEAITVGDLDISEAVTGTIQGFKDISYYRTPEGLGAHFMGSYMEAIWARLSPAEKGDAKLLFDVLSEMGAQGQPNFPYDIADAPTRSALVEQGFQSEATALDDYVGDASQLVFELFTGPNVPPDDATLSDMTPAAFPGYAPAKIPQDAPRERVDGAYTATGVVTLKFVMTEDVETPVTILGAYAKFLGAGAGRLPIVKRFVRESVLRKKGDTVFISARLSIGRTS
jgi:hypothetical protein